MSEFMLIKTKESVTYVNIDSIKFLNCATKEIYFMGQSKPSLRPVDESWSELISIMNGKIMKRYNQD